MADFYGPDLINKRWAQENEKMEGESDSEN